MRLPSQTFAPSQNSSEPTSREKPCGTFLDVWPKYLGSFVLEGFSRNICRRFQANLVEPVIFGVRNSVRWPDFTLLARVRFRASKNSKHGQTRSRVKAGHRNSSPKNTADSPKLGQHVVGDQAKFLGPAFGRTDFSRIFIFEPPDFFTDFLAGFFLLIFVGKTAQKNPPGKSPGKSSKIYTTKILQHISADLSVVIRANRFARFARIG